MKTVDIPSHLEPDIRWYDRLQWRVMVLVLLVVVLTVGASTWALVRLTHVRLHQTMGRTTIALADRVAEAVRYPLQTNRPEDLEAAVHAVRNDPCFGFAVVEDAEGQIILNVVREPRLWYEFARRVSLTPGATTYAWSSVTDGSVQAAPLTCDFMHEAMLTRHPVTAVQLDADDVSSRVDALSVSAASSADHVEVPPLGYVTVGAIDPIHRKTFSDMQRMAAIIVMLTILLSLPLTLVLVQHITRPLSMIIRATAVLASGVRPPPLPVRRSDEIGLLARLFNEMAASLAEAHEQLRSTNARLEQQVEGRTEEISRINQRLTAEIRNKNEFLRTVSHDLNAPLRNIAGMTEMIRQRFGAGLPDEVVQRLDRISANVDAETSMLDDLLELSRLRTEPAAPEVVPLQPLVERLHETVEHDLREREIIFSISGELPAVFVERRLVRQVLLNLIDNAIKYMGDREERRIEVGAAIGDAVITIWVQDTGPGIEPEDQERIFQVFQRGRRERIDQQAAVGRGVGLAGVRLVAERWDGTVSLQSEVGRGSRFTLTLPIERLCADGDVDARANTTSRAGTDGSDGAEVRSSVSRDADRGLATNAIAAQPRVGNVSDRTP